jgi:HEPN domain-containing protein
VVVAAEVGFHGYRGKLAEVLEKILKAELLRLGWSLEKTHDLDRLFDELAVRNSDLLQQIEPLVDVLSEAYFVTRYPGFDLDDPDWPALRQQLKDVEALLAAVKARVQPPPKS